VNVTKISKKKVLGIFNSSLEIFTSGEETFSFSGFPNRDLAYDRINSVWRVASPHANANTNSLSPPLMDRKAAVNPY